MEKSTQKIVYTIGHSNHSIDYFIEILKTFNITCIIDVRSVPASAYNPQYNLEILQKALNKENISYLHFGEEFGARHTEKELLNPFGKVDFDKVRKTKTFLSGVERLKKGLEKGYTISLMCSEAEPFDCHRFSMISYYLARNGFNVLHILKDKTIITNDELEKKLLTKYVKQIPKTNLFEVFSENDQINLAYRLRNIDVAYDTINT
ncbi:MAG: hypothetical protein A2X61_12865 [Ignavibacteria bacterium GWB2_35_12]|nr:MAG: hypothetical protein A2X63_03770 [Ignavibacteria bacterium GWA2_35_8]OGU41515.1 MAG: hypothetical protein A2X61_12865 [Ignavibacteria bacterium GWB2_35_12]OGU93002.1 MAG: hypothetical protein A2220_15790 [Ignavibacteria bacterium RIFOXYA2_FULL_35_10]OGV22989.1 MAG: hypothetical protein A2475_10335 [Ignavibacteria bacterium RIFOXYC2_FULL_35_21]